MVHGSQESSAVQANKRSPMGLRLPYHSCLWLGIGIPSTQCLLVGTPSTKSREEPKLAWHAQG